MHKINTNYITYNSKKFIDIGIDNILEYIIKKTKKIHKPKITFDLHKKDISSIDLLLQGSRIAPSGAGNHKKKDIIQAIPTNTQKWWAAVLLGFIFAIIASISTEEFPKVLFGTNHKPFKTTRKISAKEILFKTILFILIIRYLLW